MRLDNATSRITLERTPLLVGVSNVYDWGLNVDLSVIITSVCLTICVFVLLIHPIIRSRRGQELPPERSFKWGLLVGCFFISAYPLVLVFTADWQMVIRDAMLIQATAVCLALFAAVCEEIEIRARSSAQASQLIWFPSILFMIFGQLQLFVSATVDVIWPRATFCFVSAVFGLAVFTHAWVEDCRSALALRTKEVSVDDRELVVRLHSSFVMGSFLLLVGIGTGFFEGYRLSVARFDRYQQPSSPSDIIGAVVHGGALLLAAWVISFGMCRGLCRWKTSSLSA